MHTPVTRFYRYVAVGGSTFLLDLLLLYVLIGYVGMYYLYATAVAFLLAETVHYSVCRTCVFVGTVRSVHSAYLYFLAIAFCGLCLTLGTMYLLVGVYSFHPILSRVAAACVTGVWSFLMNLYVNFKVAHCTQSQPVHTP